MRIRILLEASGFDRVVLAIGVLRQAQSERKQNLQLVVKSLEAAKYQQ